MSFTRAILLAVFAAVFAASATRAQQETLGEGGVKSDCEMARNPVTEIGVREPYDSVITPGTVPQELPVPFAKYIRVLVQVAETDKCEPGREWFLTLRNKDHRVVQTITAEDFQFAKTRWTMRVPGHLVKFELQGCAANAPVVRITQLITIHADAKNTYYSLGGETAKYFDLFNLATDVRSLGDPVGFLMNSYLRDSWTCSGVMLTPELFLTNWHCGGLSHFPRKRLKYWDKEVIGDTLIDLSWDGDDTSREYVSAKPEVVVACEKLDFAILEVRPVNSVGRARPAVLSETPVKVTDRVRLIHHPVALSKQITTGCSVVVAERAGWRDAERVDFAHNCDTEGGSSGAPVFDERGYVVGLHHLGHTYSDDCTTKDGVNKAVRMDKILEYLKLKHRAIYDKLQVRK